MKATATTTRAMTFREATDILGLPLERIAEATGRTYGTILAYRRGDRQPPPAVLDVVVKLMREHSKDLSAAAEELRQSTRKKAR